MTEAESGCIWRSVQMTKSKRFIFGFLAIAVGGGFLISVSDIQTTFHHDVMALPVSEVTDGRVKAGNYSVQGVSGGVEGRKVAVAAFPDPPCIDRKAPAFGRVEDIFCLRLPKFEPNLTNPCFYDRLAGNTRKLRCLPYFYVIGMDKSGSTDLHGRMVRHPEIRPNKGSHDKETMFWSWKRYGLFNKNIMGKNLTLEDYLGFFEETSTAITNGQRKIITGDATPMDLWDHRGWPKIPQNWGKAEPEILTPHLLRYLNGEFMPKFIVQLREPVERLYSDYVFLGYGNNPQQFHRHAIAALNMLEDCERKHSKRWCFYDMSMYLRLPARLHLSCYSVFLEEWFRVYPRHAFHVTRTDEFKNDMSNVMKSIFRFLGVSPASDELMSGILSQSRRHVTTTKHGTVLPETRAALRKYIGRCNQETAALLQDDRYLFKDHLS